MSYQSSGWIKKICCFCMFTALTCFVFLFKILFSYCTALVKVHMISSGNSCLFRDTPVRIVHLHLSPEVWFGLVHTQVFKLLLHPQNNIQYHDKSISFSQYSGFAHIFATVVTAPSTTFHVVPYGGHSSVAENVCSWLRSDSCKLGCISQPLFLKWMLLKMGCKNHMLVERYVLHHHHYHNKKCPSGQNFQPSRNLDQLFFIYSKGD